MDPMELALAPAQVPLPAAPTTGRPQQAWSHRRLKRNSASEPMENACAKEDNTTVDVFPLHPLRVQPSVRGHASKEGQLPGEIIPVDSAPIRFDSSLSAEYDGSSLHAKLDSALNNFGSKEASATQIIAEPKSPSVPKYPLTGRPKRSSTYDTAFQTVQKQVGAHAAGKGTCDSLLESFNASVEDFVCGIEADMEGTVPEEGIRKCPEFEEAAATQTDNALSEKEFRCRPCIRETQLPSMNGCWKVCSSVDAQGSPKDVATWLSRICITNRKIVHDREGRRVSLKVRNQVMQLEGGSLHLDSRGVLHRYGKSGSHIRFRRDEQNCHVHSALLCPILELTDEE